MAKLYAKKYPTHFSSFKVGEIEVGRDFVLIGGPCSVEGREELLYLVNEIKPNIHMLRGGAFKARTSPYSFQGLGKAGLDHLIEARTIHSLPLVVELVEVSQVEAFAREIDIIQIGTRNMFNYPLLQKVARTQRPVLLKRHFSATLEEFLLAAEYILEHNPHVILCERGIRTFEPSYRNCLDLSAVVLLKQKTHLPVFVDPSHAAGDSSLVESLARASVAAGADGLILETHTKPICALSDGPQAISPGQLARLRDDAEKIRAILGF